MPVRFPDGTTAEILYPPELRLARMGAIPYSSGTLRLGKNAVARDFNIRRGTVRQTLADTGEWPAKLVEEYRGADGWTVGFWDPVDENEVNELGFQFGPWAALVSDYGVAGVGEPMTDAERVAWARNLRGRKTGDGFLVLRATGPLTLARAGEHAGPALLFDAGDRYVNLSPGNCRGVDFCIDGAMRVTADGPRRFLRLVRELEVRNVRPGR